MPRRILCGLNLGLEGNFVNLKANKRSREFKENSTENSALENLFRAHICFKGKKKSSVRCVPAR